MSIVLANLGRADAGYEQGEGDEAASEPAQSDPQGCTKTESENADGSGRQIKQAREEITPKPRCPRKTSPAAQEKGDLSHSKRADALGGRILDWAKAREFRTGENPARLKGHLDHLLPARSKVQKVQPSEVVEAALAHVIWNKVEAAYQRGDLFEKRRVLMKEWADYCSMPNPAAPSSGD